MVKYTSDGVFDGPVPKVWKLLEMHTPQNFPKIHSNFVSCKDVETKGNVTVREMVTRNPNGTTTAFRVKMIMNPPKGWDMEYLSGPMQGSKVTHAYAAQGEKTKVTVTGDVKIAGMDDASTLKMVDDNFTRAFEDDNRFLRTIK